MRKALTCLLATTMIFSSSLSVFAMQGNKNTSKVPVKETKKVQNIEKKVKTPQKGIKVLQSGTTTLQNGVKDNVAQVIENVNQSVVAVIGKNTNLRNNEEIFSKIPINLQHGSGVVIGADGRILTNNHVIDGLDEIYVVAYDGNAYKAKLLYAYKEIDLALLKIDRTDLKPIKLAKESEVKVGDEVIAIGTPLSFGYRNSASKGIISGLNRPVEQAYTYLQTDASINPGNSGGPLLNMNCELVGINTLGAMMYQGMNFSIPVGNINYFLDHYNKFGEIKRCFIGIEFEENWAALLGIPTNQGLKVVTIQKNAVVTSEQVHEGDMLEQIDGKKVTSIAQYNEILKKHLPNDKAKLTFSRENKKFDITVQLKEEIKKIENKNGKED